MPGVALNYDNDSSRSCFDALFVQNHVSAKCCRKKAMLICSKC